MLSGLGFFLMKQKKKAEKGRKVNKYRKSFVFGSNFRNGDFEGFTHFEALRNGKSHF